MGKITHFISSGKDITERMESQGLLKHLTHHDNLTGMPNRLLFQDRLRQSMSRVSWHKRIIAILFIDLASRDDISPICEKIIHSLTQPFVINGNELFVSASIGIAQFPLDGEDNKTLLKKADCLELEVTESLLIKDISETAKPCMN